MRCPNSFHAATVKNGITDLTFEEATERFVEGFRLQLASDPKPYPLPFNSITIEP
jgi:hypothetical protein